MSNGAAYKECVAGAEQTAAAAAELWTTSPLGDRRTVLAVDWLQRATCSRCPGAWLQASPCTSQRDACTTT